MTLLYINFFPDIPSSFLRFATYECCHPCCCLCYIHVDTYVRTKCNQPYWHLICKILICLFFFKKNYLLFTTEPIWFSFTFQLPGKVSNYFWGTNGPTPSQEKLPKILLLDFPSYKGADQVQSIFFIAWNDIAVTLLKIVK